MTKKQKNACIVVPCYNEQKRLPVDNFIEFYTKEKWVSFLFVNDGSSDETDKLIERLIEGRSDRMFFLNNTTNKGKGEAVREGMLKAKSFSQNFELIGYLDADLSIPLSEFKRLSKYFKNEKLTFVFGSRIRRVGVDIKKSLVRHIISRFFATIASNMLNLVVYDTQCGVKIFKSDCVDYIFKDKFESKWIFDIEIFYKFIKLYKNNSISSIAVEVPLDICLHVEGSKINLFNYIKTPFEMIKIYFIYKKKE